MDKFQEAYRQAVQKLPKLNMDAEKVQDELHHRKMQMRRRKYLITRGCAAATVFFLCGAGTVAARNYRSSIISINDNGYTITGRSAEQDAHNEENSENSNGFPASASFLQMGGGLYIEDAIPESGDIEVFSMDEYDMCDSLGEDAVEYIEAEPVEYESIEDFRAASGVVVPIPDMELFNTDFTCEDVQVSEDGREVFITLYNEDSYFYMSQLDNRGYECYSSATTFGGQSRNGRSFINHQGYSYMVFDTVDEREEIVSVHAVISLEGRDLCVSFQGFGEEIIDKVLYELDLSVYFQE